MTTYLTQFFSAQGRAQEATRPIASQEVAPPRLIQSRLPVKLKRIQHWDDSQATAISEEEFEPAVVTSPLSEWDFE